MNSEVRNEYDGIRAEIDSLKKCITQYVGFVLGGVAVALFALAKLVTSSNGDCASMRGAEMWIFSLAAVSLCLVLAAVLSILMYKFISHNRYAGYCKLLTHECIWFDEGDRPGDRADSDLSAWEVCMDLLRRAAFDSERWTIYCQTLEADPRVQDLPANSLANQFGSCFQTTTAATILKGLRSALFVFLRIPWKLRSDSWGFPMFVVRAFLLLTILLIFAAGLLVFSPDATIPTIGWWALGSEFALLVVGWTIVSWKLGKVMEGPCTVDAFCWQFLPIRFYFLSQKFTITKYSVTGSLADGEPIPCP